MSVKHYNYFLIGIGYLVFANSLFNGFVWDDEFQIVYNSAIHNGQILYYFTHTIGPYYRPLMMLSFTIIYFLFNLNSFFYHFLQVSLHIVNALLFFYILRFLSKRTLTSFLFALLFLVHPLNEEAVVYIANLQDLQFVFFGLLAFIIDVKHFGGRIINLLVLLSLILSAFAKETGILFSLMFILYVLFWKKTDRIKKIAYACSAPFIYLILRYILVGPIKPSNFNLIEKNTIVAASFTDRLITIPKIIYFYITSFFFPYTLSDQYWYFQTVSFSNFWLPLLFDFLVLIVFIVIGILIFYKSKVISRSYWFSFIWFCLGLSFHLQILPLERTVADRWFYFPMLGLLSMIVVSLSCLKLHLSVSQKNIFIAIFCLILCIFSVRTLIRNTNWYSNITLFSHDISSLQNIADIQYNYGTALYNEKQYKNAEKHLEKASKLAPKSFKIWHNLGMAYLYLNNLERAKICFINADKYNKAYDLSVRFLALTYILENNPDPANKIIISALKQFPGDPYLWRLKGLADYELKDNINAKKDFGKSMQILPDPVTDYYNSQITRGNTIVIQEL